jgi:hypothetical protein
METETTFLPLESSLSVIGETGASPGSFYFFTYFPLLFFYPNIPTFVILPSASTYSLPLYFLFPVSDLRSSRPYEYCCLLARDAVKASVYRRFGEHVASIFTEEERN